MGGLLAGPPTVVEGPAADAAAVAPPSARLGTAVTAASPVAVAPGASAGTPPAPAPNGGSNPPAHEEAFNPLRKDGRVLVIASELPAGSPFHTAVESVGRVFLSAALRAAPPSPLPDTPEARAAAWAADHAAFLAERGLPAFKVPVVGGGPLPLHTLFVAVLRLGGVENVINKRAFRVVATALALPRTCTSAAFVLRNAHERLLYAYEQALVHGREVGLDAGRASAQPPAVVPRCVTAAAGPHRRRRGPKQGRPTRVGQRRTPRTMTMTSWWWPAAHRPRRGEPAAAAAAAAVGGVGGGPQSSPSPRRRWR